jgi:hypothetical protein
MHGEFINIYEDPLNRGLLQQSIINMAVDVTGRNNNYLKSLFIGFILEAKHIDQIFIHLLKICKAALEADAYLMQLYRARKEYDIRRRKLLSSNDYNTYLEYEKRSQARLEYDKIQAFAKHEGIALESRNKDLIIDFIYEHKAYTSECWLGPYDKAPQPLIGKQQILLYNENIISVLYKCINTIEHNSSKIALSDGIRSILLAYYMSEIKKFKINMERIDKLYSENEVAKLSVIKDVLGSNIFRDTLQWKTNITSKY